MRKSGVAAIASGALGLGLAAGAPATAQEKDAARTVLVIVAHPDDELFMAPALASEARYGSQIFIVYATSGDAGPGVSGMDKGEGLGAVREKEARCSAEALGAVPVFLRFGDGQLTRAAGNVSGTAPRLREKLTEEIARLNPQTVMTWGPGGGYGHTDHRMVSALTTEVIQALDPDMRPTLLYSGIAKGRTPKGTPLRNWAETDASLLTVTYDYSDDDLARANAAARCHVTQFEETFLNGLMDFFDQHVWQGEVGFRPAFPEAGRP